MPTVAAQRINRLVEVSGAQRYLEVGPDRGPTIGDVAAPRKSTLLEAPSGFASLEPYELFDIVYLRGQRSFEQAYRELCGALVHTHSRSVIVIDDTVPSDDGTTADIYKVVLAIHDLHPTLDFATITVGGKPQTIVWRGVRSARTPAFASVVELAGAGTDVLQERPELLQPMTFLACIAQFKEALGHVG